MPDPFVIWQNERSPSPSDTITKLDGSIQNLTGCSVAFSMRPAGSSTPKVDHAAATIVGDPTTGKWQYDWIVGDTDTPGTFLGWVTVTLATGKTQSTPEFEVEVAAHATAGTYALVTVEEMVDHMSFGNMARRVTENDYQKLRSLILAASNRCAEYTNHRFAVETGASHVFRYDGDVVLDLSPHDLRSVTTITMDSDVSGYALDPSQYRLEPRNMPHGVYTHLDLIPFQGGAPSGGLNWWGGGGTFGAGIAQFGRQVTILGDWGWTTIPESMKEGVKVLVARAFQNPTGAQSVETASVKLQFTRGTASGGAAAVGDDLPDEVRSAWRPFMRAAA